MTGPISAVPGLGAAPPHLVKIHDGKAKRICFATMCKNEAHCIRATLEAVRPHVDSYLVYDTGSTDGTLDVVHAFFDDHGIDRQHGRMITSEWEGFARSKTQMMTEARSRTQWDVPPDYILHLDADDVLVAFDPSAIHAGADLFYATLERGPLSFQATILYDARLTWKFCGVAHTTIRALDKPELSYGNLPGCRVDASERGSRKYDPDKYAKDAALLVRQFKDTEVDDPDGLHARSAFYAAQSYFDARAFMEAHFWYGQYLDIASWDEEVFEAHLRRARCLMARSASQITIRADIDRAIAIEPDRAEPHLYFGIWCNQNGYHEEAYRALKDARTKSFEAVVRRYLLFVNPHAYGKYLVNELAVACYWTGRYAEGKALIAGVLDDPELSYDRPNLAYNLDQLELAAARTGQEIRGITRKTARLIVVDDFYEDPGSMRSIALAMTFTADDRYHKGRRTLELHRPDYLKAEIERLLNRSVSKWDYGTNGVFQICKAGDPLVYHGDDQQYAAAVYLTPDAPVDSGLSLFRDRRSGARALTDVPAPLFERGYYDASQFDLVDKIGNVFNRCVIWDAKLIHAASSYFGDKDENARLFQMFFFDLA